MNSHRSAYVNGEILREARKKFYLSNKEMASACGISRGVLDRAMYGKPVGVRSIAKIAKRLDVTMEELTGKVKILPRSFRQAKHSKSLFVEVKPHLDEKLCRITQELNERVGIDDPVCAIRYLIMTYVLEEGNDLP
jgi:transcriptional regulator with XRE-family HTH domain